MSSSSEWGAIPELEGLQERWEGMQASSRQKLLVSFLHLPRQASEAHTEALEALIALAQQDEDEWVSLLGAVLVGYPRTGQLAYHAAPLLRTAESLAALLPPASWEASDQYSLAPCIAEAAANGTTSAHFAPDTSAVDASKAWSHKVEPRRASPTPTAAANAAATTNAKPAGGGGGGGSGGGGPPVPGRASTAPAALQATGAGTSGGATCESDALGGALDTLAAARHASAPTATHRAAPAEKAAVNPPAKPAPSFLIPKALAARPRTLTLTRTRTLTLTLTLTRTRTRTRTPEPEPSPRRSPRARAARRARTIWPRRARAGGGASST